MKHSRLLLILLITTLFLAACERPVRDSLDVETTVPGTVPLDDKPVDELIIPPGDEVPADGTEGDGADGTTDATPADGAETPADGTAEDGTTDETTDAQTPGEAQDIIYVVQAGDTLSTVALLYGVNVADMVTVNGLANPDDLEVGQQLIVPLSGNITPPGGESGGETGGETGGGEIIHVVRSGETLFRIDQAYGVDMQGIIDLNQLANPDRLDVGQELRIPQ